MLDILSSDYIPFSLIQSAFFLGEVVDGITLPQAVAMVSKNPAEAVGLDDRGVIEIGRRADLVRVRVDEHIPVVRTGLARRPPRRMMASALIERELASAAFPVRNGVFIAVVGPSGAGKDTIIDYAREKLRDEGGVEFVRRVITRPSDAASEDHDTLADAAFDEAERPAPSRSRGRRMGCDMACRRMSTRRSATGAWPSPTCRAARCLLSCANVTPMSLVVEITARHEMLAATAFRPRPRIAGRSAGAAGPNRSRGSKRRRRSPSTTAVRARRPANCSSPSSARPSRMRISTGRCRA